MSVNFNGASVNYDRSSNTYSRSPVMVFRVCNNGYKRPMRSEPDECPCFKCAETRNGNRLIKEGLMGKHKEESN